MADNKDLELKEFCDKLAKGLKEKVEAFGQKCLELRQIELKKSAEEICPLCGNFDSPSDCLCLKKSEPLEKVSPPGFSEKTMHELKNKYGTESAFKVAWAAHNKGKEKSKTKKNATDPASYATDAGQGAPSMMMAETKPNLKEFPKLDDPDQGYSDASDNHPGNGTAAPSDSTAVAKKPKLKKDLPSDMGIPGMSGNPGVVVEATKVGGKSAVSVKEVDPKKKLFVDKDAKLKPGKHGNKEVKVLDKTEDYIDGNNDNDHKKRLKSVGGKNTILPGDKDPKDMGGEEGSGGKVIKGKALSKDEMKAKKAEGMGTPAAAKPSSPKLSGSAPKGMKMSSSLPKKTKSRTVVSIVGISAAPVGISGASVAKSLNKKLPHSKSELKPGSELALKPVPFDGKGHEVGGVVPQPDYRKPMAERIAAKAPPAIPADAPKKSGMKKMEAAFGQGFARSEDFYKNDYCPVCKQDGTKCKCTGSMNKKEQ